MNNCTVSFALILVLTMSSVHAEIVTDGSMGPQISISGIDVEINESLGTRSGNNLFHSFQTFNIDLGGSATFTGASDISNVISRVTGGEVSNIQGVLRSQVGAADFYFVNPAGVTFGPGGSVDVPASIHLSTAEMLHFSNRMVLDLTNPTSSTLSMASPEAFGFLGSAGNIQVVDTGVLIRGAGGLSFSSSDMVLQNSTLGALGDMEFVAVGGAPVRFDLRDGVGSVPSGQMTLLNRGHISGDTFGARDGGNINLAAGQLLIDGQGDFGVTGITSQANSGTGNAGSIKIRIAESATIKNRGIISNDTFAEGDAGNIELIADQLLIQNGGRISNDTFSMSDAGSIKLIAGQLLIDDQGDGVGGTGIFSRALGTTGNAGGLDVTIAESTNIIGGSISSTTQSEGDAGSIKLIAGQLFIDSGGGFGGIMSEAQAGSTGGNAGMVDVTIAGIATIQNQGLISSNSFAEGDAGSVSLTAGQLLLEGGSVISSEAGGRGRFSSTGEGGSIRVTIAGLATIRDQGRISSTTDTDGDAGSIQLTANQLLIEDRSTIGSSSGGGALLPTMGNAGIVEIAVIGNLEIRNSEITSAAVFRSLGAAGSVRITADRMIVDGLDSDRLTGIFTSSVGNSAGPVAVIGNSLVLRNSQISTATESEIADGGSITIPRGVLVLDSGFIQANAVSGQGGAIVIDSGIIGSSGNQITVGGIERLEFQLDGPNVIQAVAPSGVSVPPSLNAPDVDVIGSLTGLDAAFDDAIDLAFDPCTAFIAGAPSTLTIMGRGSLPSDLSFSLGNRPVDQFGGGIGKDKQSGFSVAAMTKLYTTKPRCVVYK